MIKQRGNELAFDKIVYAQVPALLSRLAASLA